RVAQRFGGCAPRPPPPARPGRAGAVGRPRQAAGPPSGRPPRPLCAALLRSDGRRGRRAPHQNGAGPPLKGLSSLTGLSSAKMAILRPFIGTPGQYMFAAHGEEYVAVVSVV